MIQKAVASHVSFPSSWRMTLILWDMMVAPTYKMSMKNFGAPQKQMIITFILAKRAIGGIVQMTAERMMAWLKVLWMIKSNFNKCANNITLISTYIRFWKIESKMKTISICPSLQFCMQKLKKGLKLLEMQRYWTKVLIRRGQGWGSSFSKVTKFLFWGTF